MQFPVCNYLEKANTHNYGNRKSSQMSANTHSRSHTAAISQFAIKKNNYYNQNIKSQFHKDLANLIR